MLHKPSIPTPALFAFAVGLSRQQARTCAARNALTRARSACEWLAPVLRQIGAETPSIAFRSEDLRAALDVLDAELPELEEDEP